MSCSKCDKKEFEASGLCKIHLVERRKYDLRKREIRIKNNRCLRCDKPPTKGMRKCEECRAADRKNYRLRYEAKKAAGLCVYAGGCQTPTHGYALCEKHRDNQRKHSAKNRIKRHKYQMRRRKIRIKNNLCIVCDKPPTKGMQKCEECRAVDSKKRKLRYEEKKSAGLCVHDGCQLPAHGKAQCEKHLQKAKNAIAKRRKKAKKEK